MNTLKHTVNKQGTRIFPSGIAIAGYSTAIPEKTETDGDDGGGGSGQGCGFDGISIKAEVKAGPFRRGQGRGRGRIEAGLWLSSNQQIFTFAPLFPLLLLQLRESS